jgi:hypothetical protein
MITAKLDYFFVHENQEILIECKQKIKDPKCGMKMKSLITNLMTSFL